MYKKPKTESPSETIFFGKNYQNFLNFERENFIFVSRPRRVKIKKIFRLLFVHFQFPKKKKKGGIFPNLTLFEGDNSRIN